MDREEANQNFSSNDPVNVRIPDSLGPISFEFFDSFVYILKNSSNLIGVYEALISLLEINKFN